MPPTRSYLVGVSGGRDSVVLLHLLANLGYRKLVVCHLDHRLRGRASAADARFVERLALRLGFPAVIERTDVSRMGVERGMSIETAARAARHEFFARVASGKRCHTIFLAHHADDQVETFLFNLFRGAGASGLGAMRGETQLGALRIVRPLLGVWRAEIDAFAERHGLKFREDATNTQPAHSRNRMRHQLIPAIEKIFGREIKQAVWRSAEILAAEDEWIRGLISTDTDELSVRQLREMPVAMQRRIVQSWLKRLRVPDAGFREVESVRALLPASATKAKVNLPAGLHARRRAGKLFVE